jgi:hypothetical protein
MKKIITSMIVVLAVSFNCKQAPAEGAYGSKIKHIYGNRSSRIKKNIMVDIWCIEG